MTTLMTTTEMTGLTDPMTTITDFTENDDDPMTTTISALEPDLSLFTDDFTTNGPGIPKEWARMPMMPEPRSMPGEWARSAIPVPHGVLQNPDGTSAKKRCRCIEKKRRKVLKEIKYIPLAPSIHLDGVQRNFTCKCSHLRKLAKGMSVL